jgi:hypothetical protein
VKGSLPNILGKDERGFGGALLSSLDHVRLSSIKKGRHALDFG